MSETTRKLAKAEQTILELKAHLNRYQSIFYEVVLQTPDSAFKDVSDYTKAKIDKAISDIPTQSLAKHDAETISDVVVDAYTCGYERGHNDTVESQYGDAEDLAQDYLDEILSDKLGAGEL